MYSANINTRGIDNGDGQYPNSSRYLIIFNTTFNIDDDYIAVKSGKNADWNIVTLPIRNSQFFSFF